jgi:hypothetical protein
MFIRQTRLPWAIGGSLPIFTEKEALQVGIISNISLRQKGGFPYDPFSLQFAVGFPRNRIGQVKKKPLQRSDHPNR